MRGVAHAHSHEPFWRYTVDATWPGGAGRQAVHNSAQGISGVDGVRSDVSGNEPQSQRLLSATLEQSSGIVGMIIPNGITIGISTHNDIVELYSISSGHSQTHE
jgi:hypothetical protein